ncbi:nitrilase-like protein 2 isoform X2 [Selaginella moellendorffii]|uniref:nitrilase-like protein 2 isoform X2 n=1 Tax=Selaginella moellendorffii TaxID=88036 RepID=UPI000D1CF7F4|nr:nitrilase-like protein 2 isoform X2 [Selaginella moellendorffii]|eukprot:XP_024519434.1 nitrilase-like protein 2 isoform X2 [Selaginella moellendorffii]
MVPASTGSAMRVAVAQMTSTSSIDLNFATCQRLAREAADAGVKLLSLPECFSFIGRRGDEALAIAEPLDGPIFRRYQALARDLGLWLSLGGFQEKGPDEDHAYNTHVLLDDLGSVRSCYRKIHLFDVDVPGGPVLKESNRTAPGTQVVTAQTPVGTLGLTICYDLRFPELYQRLRFAENAQVLLVPSAFTRKTGEAHWELLLRARAVETQCYVLAAAQSGKHNDLRESYGDAMIIDPWGSVVARCPDRLVTGIAVADIDEELLKTVRRNMPIAEHRKYNIYGSDRQLSTL